MVTAMVTATCDSNDNGTMTVMTAMTTMTAIATVLLSFQ
jgi:hypothetical protein